MLHSEVKRQCLFTSVKLRLVSNLRKKINNWNSEKVYLVVCSRLLVICGRLLLVCGRLWWFVVVCWWFVVICGGLWSLPVLVTTILDLLGNDHEIYANVTKMTLLNLNHFWITQAELCLKRTFLKASFMFVAIFLNINKSPRRNTFLNPSCPKHHKIINWNKKWHKLIFKLLCDTSKRFHEGQKVFTKSFWGTKEKCENEKILSFPVYSGLGRQGLSHFCFLNNRDRFKQNLKYKNKTSLLAHYSFSVRKLTNTFHYYSVTICS